MEKIDIVSTKSTPEVRFDPENHVLSIKGESYPENAFKFYEPLLDWIDEYFSIVPEHQHIQINFDLAYINTSSTKCFMMLLDKFEEAFQDGKKLQLTWYYNSENENELECAEEFKEDMSFPFEIVVKEE